MSARNLPIIALDFRPVGEVHTFLNRFNEPLYVKTGMGLFYQIGPALIKSTKERGHDTFLDLKLHDVPNTVSKAMESLACLDVNLVNVHAAGGVKMMEEAKEGLRKHNANTKIVAVTRLTPITERQLHEEQDIRTSIEEAVLNYACLTKKAGLDGVVCSPLEAEMVSRELGTSFLKMTPGIRPKGAVHNDQQRIAAPERVKTSESTHIVVGRLITQSKRPANSYHKIKEGWLSQMTKNIAKALLDIEVVSSSPNDLSTWNSGIKSPMYCDNRVILGHPEVRNAIRDGLVQLVKEHFSNVEIISGTATTGIPHAAYTSEKLELPINYVRLRSKSYGKQNQIEGAESENRNAIVVEDLISTGGSSVTAVEASEEMGANVPGVVAVFTYGLAKADKTFNKTHTPFYTLSDYDELIEIMKDEDKIFLNDIRTLVDWRDNLS